MSLALLAALMLSGPTANPGTAEPCASGMHAVATAELFFGRDIAGGQTVTEADWRNFLDSEVTTRFPEGLTVWDAQGQWRDPAGVLSREPAKVLRLILAGLPDETVKLSALIAAYKRRFHQESVLLVQSPACAAF